MQIELKLEAFEGPLDLLLYLIERAEIDVFDIPISAVTEQYMEVLTEMQRLELEVASEFLVMAATLLAMKSRMLLPQPEPDPLSDLYDEEEELIDPREQLIMRLIEYKRFKMLAEKLKARGSERAQVFSRLPADLGRFMPPEEPPRVQDVSVYQLIDAFQTVLQKTKPAQPRVRSVQREELSIQEQIDALRAQLQQNEQLFFSELFEEMPTREAVIVTFLALLELMKKREVTCWQDGRFAEIVISAYAK
ncbi:segregation and condensation protein A [Numidum massiliense]|uniref:segregation and condensation protein A n=1 Tax=Numidum massiliense TaxID=1522315 RepID=UPI0006D5345B|nr:segregation/condensation protein A [Numidum massiliense]